MGRKLLTWILAIKFHFIFATAIMEELSPGKFMLYFPKKIKTLNQNSLLNFPVIYNTHY